MKQRIKVSRPWLLNLGLWSLCLTGLALTGCVIGGGSGEAIPSGGPHTISAQNCADLTPAQQKSGDSLVALAQKLQAGDMDKIVSLKNTSWQSIDEDKANQAVAIYDQALTVAPGHCAALFGRAMSRAGTLLQNQVVNDAVVQSLQKGSASKSGASLPVAQAYKANPDEAAPLVLRVVSGLASVDKPYLSQQQERLSTEFLPQLDSIISSLNAVMAKGDFAFTYVGENGKVTEIDAGEVGPMLGGMKIARAILLVVCGYQWEIAKDGSYSWMDHLGNLSDDDLSHLNSTQRSDLDHMVGLFQVGNPFTRVKPEWKSEVRNIPNLLLEAVENTQTGLRYALLEAGQPDKQINDLYRVGTGENDDLDPTDVTGMINALERTKKYLKGEVTLSYHQGTHTLRLDFPKIFAWDGMQNFLPQFKVNKYEQWVVPMAPIDSSIEGDWAFDLNGTLAYNKIMQVLDLPSDDAIEIRASLKGNFQVILSEDFTGWFSNSYRGPDVVLAELTPDGDGCSFKYVKTNGRTRMRPAIFADEDTFVLTDDLGKGTFALGNSCRVNNGRHEYLISEIGTIARPFYFTNSNGVKTLEIDEVDAVVEDLGLAGLTGKIFFKDPTFGGVFPDLNNDNIWSTIQSLQNSGANFDEKCDKMGNNCIKEIPKNPSDLDVWAHYLIWTDDLL